MCVVLNYVLNYVFCTELCTKLCALYSDCLSVAESFPDAKDPNKARLSLGYREGKAVVMVVYLGRCVASLAVFNSECSESDRKCSY